jgi:hypothetical protein
MNHYYRLSGVLIIMLCIVSLLPAGLKANPSLLIEEYDLSPDVFLPGDTGLLTLTITNAESTSTSQESSSSGGVTTVTTETVGSVIENIWVTANGDGTKNVKATVNYEEVGELAPGASMTIAFKVIAEAGISEGTYFPVIHLDLEHESYQDVAYPLPVQVSIPSVNVTCKEVPSMMSMSGSTDITLCVANTGSFSVDAVRVMPEDSSDFSFMPESSFLGSLAAHSSQDVTFSLSPLSTGEKNLTFTVWYKNGENEHSARITVPLQISDILDVAPVFYSLPSTVQQGESARVRLEVYNAKSTAISGVIVVPTSEVSVFPSQYFIGSMDPDDVFSASFDIDTAVLPLGNHSIGFKVMFKQDEDYYETPSVSRSFSVVAADASGGQGAGILVIAGGIIAVVLAAFLVLMWYKRRRT